LFLETTLIKGYAKRYFTLSVSTGELSYSQNSHNPLLRGTIPLALAALNIDYGRREFILDSGSDIWHLKASNESEFAIWKTRLEDIWLKAVAGRKRALQDEKDGLEIPTEWKQVEGLVDRLSMMKDFVKGIVQDVFAEGNKSTHSLTIIDSTRDLKAKDGKERRGILKKKEKQTPPSSPLQEHSAYSMNTIQGMEFAPYMSTNNIRSFSSRYTCS
jgi:oxysterol-binding protein-related protein 3/6/7